ncbi:MAG: hypothetical protein WCL51_18110 [Bacteroidota bacterium]
MTISNRNIINSICDSIINVLENKLFFLLIILLNLYPVLTNRFFATLDGPAHLYNAKLINDLLLNHNSITNSIFKFNIYITPNCLGHFILSFFLIFLPAWMAEKALLILFLLLLPLSFRYLLTCLNANKIYSYFIIPFTYTFLFILGFYNFLIGLSFIFFGLGYFYKYLNQDKLKHYFLLFIFSLLIYLSNPLLLILWLFCLFIIFFINIFQIFSIERNWYLKKNIRKALLTLTAFLPVVLLIFKYITIQHNSFGNRIPFNELIKWLYKIRALIVFSFGYEQRYTVILFIIFIVLIISLLFNLINKNSRNSTYKRFISSISILIFTIVIFILYFILPDEMAGGGYISIRLNLLLFLFFIIFLSYFEVNKILLSSAFILTLIIHISLMSYHVINMNSLNKYTDEMYNCNKFIKENSTILTINKTDNWMQSHLSNYAGLNNNIILSDNYEAYNSYFPLLWKNNSFMNYKFFLESSSGFDNKLINTNRESQSSPDYILLYGNNPLKSDNCESEIKITIDTNYILIHNSSDNFIKLFKLKSNQ